MGERGIGDLQVLGIILILASLGFIPLGVTWGLFGLEMGGFPAAMLIIGIVILVVGIFLLIKGRR
ncbi:hypothetical protein ES703_52514 [subsurface metagenome]